MDGDEDGAEAEQRAGPQILGPVGDGGTIVPSDAVTGYDYAAVTLPPRQNVRLRICKPINGSSRP